MSGNVTFTRCVKVPARLAQEALVAAPLDTDSFFALVQSETILIVSTLSLVDSTPDLAQGRSCWLAAVLNLNEVDAAWRHSEYQPFARPSRKSYKLNSKANQVYIVADHLRGPQPTDYLQIRALYLAGRKRKSTFADELASVDDGVVILPELDNKPPVKRRRRSLDQDALLQQELDMDEEAEDEAAEEEVVLDSEEEAEELPEESSSPTGQKAQSTPLWTPIDMSSVKKASAKNAITSYVERSGLLDIQTSLASRKFSAAAFGPCLGRGRWPLIACTGSGDAVFYVLEWSALQTSNPQPLPIISLLTMDLFEILHGSKQFKNVTDLRQPKPKKASKLKDIFTLSTQLTPPCACFARSVVLGHLLGFVAHSDVVFVWLLPQSRSGQTAKAQLLNVIVLPTAHDWAVMVTKMECVVTAERMEDLTAHACLLAATSAGHTFMIGLDLVLSLSNSTNTSNEVKGKASSGKASARRASPGRASPGKASPGRASLGRASPGKTPVGRKTTLGKSAAVEPLGAVSLQCVVNGCRDICELVESLPCESPTGPSLDSKEPVSHLQILETLAVSPHFSVVTAASSRRRQSTGVIALMKSSTLYTFDANFARLEVSLRTLTSHVASVPLCPVGLTFSLTADGRTRATVVDVKCGLWSAVLQSDPVWIEHTKGKTIPTQSVLVPWMDCKSEGDLEWEETETVPASQRRLTTTNTLIRSCQALGPALMVGCNTYQLYSDVAMGLTPTNPVANLILMTISALSAEDDENLTATAAYMDSLRLASRGRISQPAQLPDILVKPGSLMTPSKAHLPALKDKDRDTSAQTSQVVSLTHHCAAYASLAAMDDAEAAVSAHALTPVHRQLLTATKAAFDAVFVAELQNQTFDFTHTGWTVDALLQLCSVLNWTIWRLNRQNDKVGMTSSTLADMVGKVWTEIFSAMVRGSRLLSLKSQKPSQFILRIALVLLMAPVHFGLRLRALLHSESAEETNDGVRVTDEVNIKLEDHLTSGLLRVYTEVFNWRQLSERVKWGLPEELCDKERELCEAALLASEASTDETHMTSGSKIELSRLFASENALTNPTVTCNICRASMSADLTAVWVDLASFGGSRCVMCAGSVAELIE